MNSWLKLICLTSLILMKEHHWNRIVETRIELRPLTSHKENNYVVFIDFYIAAMGH